MSDYQSWQLNGWQGKCLVTLETGALALDHQDRGDAMKSVVFALLLFALTASASVQRSVPRTSGIYLTAADYNEGRLTSEGDCGFNGHKLELHDVLDKSYIHVTHGTERRRYAKSDLFGFRACDGNDYRFVSNLEFRILEAKELSIYVRETHETVGKSRHVVKVYYLSKGSNGNVLPLTLENLKHAFPDNHTFHDSLDQMFGAGQDLAQYDDFHKMFKVNRLLIAAHTPELH